MVLSDLADLQILEIAACLLIAFMVVDGLSVDVSLRFGPGDATQDLSNVRHIIIILTILS